MVPMARGFCAEAPELVWIAKQFSPTAAGADVLLRSTSGKKRRS